MMISEKMNQTLNQQIAHEMNASFVYLAMSFAFDALSLKVFGKWFHSQADEERSHAMKIAGYIQDVGGTVVLEAVAKPKADYNSAQSMIETALASEMKVTEQINNLVALAESEKDYATQSFLQWFVDEQVEEVSSMTELLQLVKLAGESNLFLAEGRLIKMMATK